MTAAALTFPIEGARVRIEVPGADGASAIIRQRDGAPVGTLRLEANGATLTVQSLCIDDEARSFGCGSDAGYELLRAAQAGGFDLLRAWAPPGLGLAVYYWFRMGFRPIFGPGPEGGIWLERRLG